MPNILIERAPAKINLTLHIVGRRADGFHNLESLVAFSRGGDTLSLTAGEPLSLSIEGPTAAASGRVEDNLVLRAARHFVKRFPGAKLGAFHLVKRLPVAAGLGGGSSDAAAALRLLARANGAARSMTRCVFEAAKATGADVPVCLMRRARMMRGVGDELGPLIALPPLIGLLVNPGEPGRDESGLRPDEDRAGQRRPDLAAIPSLLRTCRRTHCSPPCARAATTWRRRPAC